MYRRKLYIMDNTPIFEQVMGLDNRSYALYAPDHIAKVIERTLDIIRDVEYSIGLSPESKRVLLRKAIDSLAFLNDVMKDSMETLKDIQFKNYSDEKKVSGESCACDEENFCDCCKEAEA